MNDNARRLLVTLGLGLGFALALVWLLGSSLPGVRAASGDVYCVTPGGGTYPDCTQVFTNVQAAVDAASGGEEIRVAAGTYTGVRGRAAPPGYLGPSLITQVVYVSTTVTIQGGYTTTNWTVADPLANPTTLDAQGQGRVLYVASSVSPTLAGLRITGGDATGLDGGPGWKDVGGGVYVITAAATISNNTVFGNAADYGGGLALDLSAATVSGNTVFSNTATDRGGGVYLTDSPATLSGNTVFSNITTGRGGGLYLWVSDAALSDNAIISNTAAGDGGGLFLAASDAALSGNTVCSNTATGDGGGLYLDYSVATVGGNVVSGNAAGGYGGGFHLDALSDAGFTNNVVADNRAGTSGSGLYIGGSSPHLRHTTIARNTGGDGSVVYVTVYTNPLETYYSAVPLTNTILVSHSVGISVTGGNAVAIDGVLWDSSTPVTVSQSTTAVVAVQNQYTGDPAFAADGYHLRAGSAAIDKGVGAGVTADIDGEARDLAPDLGADEHRVCWVRLNDGLVEYGAVQAAVDASTQPTDVIKVAGYCPGVQMRAGLTQTVYVSKTVTIRGGYTTTNGFADPPNPLSNPTALDAQGQGRVFYIAGNVSPTIGGLRITGGDAGTGNGGGLYLAGAAVTISGNSVISNAARNGGGIYLVNSVATLGGNTVVSNTASDGGGVYLTNSPATLSGNTIVSNSAANGGGLLLARSDATLSRNSVTANAASGEGGGLYLWNSAAALSGNTVTANTAGGKGGGMYLFWSNATLANNLVADNRANGQGSGLYVEASAPRLLHTTIARNGGGDGSGIYASDAFGIYSTIALTNTIVASNTVGVFADAGNAATLEGTLWGSGAWANENDWGGTGTIDHSNDLGGDPAFLAPAVGDYHIGLASAAMDAGVATSVADDIDGDLRPQGLGYDVGADETGLAVTKQASPSPVDPGAQLTYTIRITNTSGVTLSAAITDILPGHVVPGGVFAWSPVTITPGLVWTRTLIVTVETGYTGLLTNVVQVTTQEGVNGACIETSTVGGGIYVYLPLVMRND
jgi:uncharacterized repeat protein (TIGR01451 family)